MLNEFLNIAATVRCHYGELLIYPAIKHRLSFINAGLSGGTYRCLLMATTETPWLNELSHCGGHFCPFLEVTTKLTLKINGTVVGQASYTLRYLRISEDTTGKVFKRHDGYF